MLIVLAARVGRVSTTTNKAVIICQHCGAENTVDRLGCHRCSRKLFVVSTRKDGVSDTSRPSDGIPLEEHLIERVSLLEEALRTTVGGLQRSVSALRRLERNNMVGQAGMAAVEELLVEHDVIDADEFRRAWNNRLHKSLLAEEKHQVLEDRKERILAEFAGEEPELFASQVDEALEAFAAFDSASALSHLDRALRLDSGNPQLASLVGELHFLAGHSARALSRFEDALTRDSEQYDALVYSSILLYESGHTTTAHDRLRKAVGVRPGEFLGWLALGSLCLAKSELREATVYLERALEIDRVPTALGLLGQSYRRMGKFGRAIALLEEARQLDPAAAELVYELGRAYVARGWGNKGKEALSAALKLNPMAHGLGVLGNELPIPPDSSWQPHLRQASELTEEGRYSEACRCAERVLATCEQSGPLASAGAMLIEALRAQGRLREGLDWAERLMSIDDPLVQFVGSYEAAFSLAELEQELDRALQLAARGLALEVPQLRAEATAVLGWVHYKRNELDLALEMLEKAVKLGENAAHLKLLGLVHLARGETTPANTLLERAEGLVETEASSRPHLSHQLLEQLKVPNTLNSSRFGRIAGSESEGSSSD